MYVYFCNIYYIIIMHFHRPKLAVSHRKIKYKQNLV